MIPVGLSTTSVYPLSVGETFAISRDVGYDGIEIMVSYAKASQDPKILRKLADRFDQPILSIHAPTLILTQFTGGRDPLTKLRRSCELAKAVDAPTVVAHPPFRWQNGYSANFLSIISDLSAEYEVNIAVENMFPWRVRGKRAANIYSPDWDTLTQKADALTIDFSHASLSGLDAYEMIRQSLDKVAHIHLCDGAGVQKLDGKKQVMDQHLLPGQGGQRIRESLDLLAASSWKGSVVAEINTRGMKRMQEKTEALAYTLDYALAALGR